MSRHTMIQMLVSLRRTVSQCSMMIALGPVIGGMALAPYHNANPTADQAAYVGTMCPTTWSFDPNQQAVMDYLRAHGANLPPYPRAATDPVAQAALDYLCLHLP